MLPVLFWWLIVQILGLLALPLTMRIFRWLPDRGYTGAKAVGLLVTSYLLWLGGSSGFLRNDLGGIFFSMLILGGLSIWQWARDRKLVQTSTLTEAKIEPDPIIGFLRNNLRLILTAEALFTLAFILWAVLRAFAADKIMNAGGEKFMEIAFMNGVLNSESFPPLDPWLSGFAIAYYYFGYVMMAMMTRVSGVPSGVGFDLYDALLFALTALGAFGVLYNLVAARSKQSRGSSGQGIGFGLLGALFVTVLGNLTGPLEALRSLGALPQKFFEWIDIPGLAAAPVTGSWFPGVSSGWWWWRGSRVIQDYDLVGNPFGISPITEFPFFSFLLGDNHPHVLGLPFVILAISLAYNLLRSQAALPPPQDAEEALPVQWWNPVQFSLRGESALFWFGALLFGSLAFLNTWDFPIYLGLGLLAYTSGQALRYGRLSRTILTRSIVLAGWLFLGGIGLYLFFYTSFDSQAGGILPYVFPPTRLVQYLVMFGIFIFIILSFLLTLTASYAREGLDAWRTILRAWGTVLLAGAGLYVLVGLVLASGEWLGQAFPGIDLTNIQASLGGLPLGQIARRYLIDRLADPWLFLTIAALVGFAAALLQLTISMQNVRKGAASPEDRQLGLDLNTSNLFILLVILVGLLLTWSVEFFYLQDSFMLRMNTVFKFYYQGWVMLAIGSAYGLWWLSSREKSWLPVIRQTALFIAGLFTLAGMVYPVMAFYSRTNGFATQPDLDGASGIARSHPDDWAAIQWLLKESDKLENIPVILEAPGKSYNYEGRISAFTGLPAVLGWSVHESQWRGSYEEQAKREPDIAAIYATHDGPFALDLLRKWNVTYVILGWPEQNYIQQLCAEETRRCNAASAMRKFNQVLEPVFSQGLTTIYRVPGQ